MSPSCWVISVRNMKRSFYFLGTDLNNLNGALTGFACISKHAHVHRLSIKKSSILTLAWADSPTRQKPKPVICIVGIAEEKSIDREKKSFYFNCSLRDTKSFFRRPFCLYTKKSLRICFHYPNRIQSAISLDFLSPSWARDRPKLRPRDRDNLKILYTYIKLS